MGGTYDNVSSVEQAKQIFIELTNDIKSAKGKKLATMRNVRVQIHNIIQLLTFIEKLVNAEEPQKPVLIQLTKSEYDIVATRAKESIQVLELLAMIGESDVQFRNTRSKDATAHLSSIR